VSLQRDLNRPDNVEVLRYTTNASQPDYLRLATLDTFVGSSWEPAKLDLRPGNRVNQMLPDPPGLSTAVARQSLHSRIEISGRHLSKWLALPYPPREVWIEGDWRYDDATLNVFSPKSTSRGVSYEVSWLSVAPTAEQLRAAGDPPEAIADRYLALPDNLPKIVQDLAKEATNGANTHFDQARILERWFRSKGHFKYSLKARSGSSATVLEDFLAERVGYCEQFAATMALMARSLGIPARVNVGFTPGTQETDASYVVRAHDYHAWPELYFAGTGWVRFEPTPTGDGRTVQPSWTSDQLGGDGSAADPTAEPANSAGATGVPTGPGGADRGGPEDRTSLDGSSGANEGRLPVVRMLVVAAVLLLLGLPAMARAVVRRRRWAGAAGPAAYASAAWDELRDSAIDLGYAWSRTETPRQTAARLAEEGRLAEAERRALAWVARAVERTRYARVPGEVGDLREEVGTVVGGLRAGTGRLWRWQARLLPRSTRRLLTVAAERIADVLDWVDAAGARLHAGVRRRLQLRG
jgi:transglutaminase-like putative cysteine protease